MPELKQSVVDKAEGENYNLTGLFGIAAKAELIKAKGQHA